MFKPRCSRAVDIMQQVDPEVKYETQLDELRTLQDNIDDPKSPETPENAYAQLQATRTAI